MPLWVMLYFTVYVGFSIWAHISEFQKEKISAHAILEPVGDVCLLLPALSYWYPQFNLIFGSAIVAFFAVGLASFVYSIFRGFRKHYPDIQLSLSENIGLSTFSTVSIILVASPLIFWGGESVKNIL